MAVWLVTTVVFVVMRLSGDPVPLLLPPDAPTSEIMRVRHELGLDRSLPVQYAVFIGNALRGDFGRSIHFRQPALDVVRGYLGASVELGLTAFVFAALAAVPIGLISALRRNSLIDHAEDGMTVAAVRSRADVLSGDPLHPPALAQGRPLPTGGRGTAKPVLPRAHAGGLRHGLPSRGSRARPCWEVLRADYIRTARPRAAEVLVVAKHTLRNAALPIVTITGLQFATLLGGAVVTETVFAWPGIGRLAIQSIYNRDYPVVQCTVFLSAVMFIVINFAIELLYGALDPRVRPRS